jgi:RNA polymerase sigma factor (sigma-70 family)
LLNPATYTEEELVARLKLHEEQAFSMLYDNYSKALFGVICQIVPQQEMAQDLLQQVFVKIWKNMESYDPSKGRLFTWMLHIARNQAKDFFRSKEVNKQGKTVSLSEDVYINEKTTTVAIRDHGLQKVLERLPEENRRLLELSYFLGYTHEEIAEILNIPLGTVKTRLRSTIMELRKHLNLKT